MTLGLGVLRWSPHDFWGATPRELAACLPPRDEPALRADLDRLIGAYPDVAPSLRGTFTHGRA